MNTRLNKVPEKGSYVGEDALEVYLKYFKPNGYHNRHQADLEYNINYYGSFEWAGKQVYSGNLFKHDPYILKQVVTFFDSDTQNDISADNFIKNAPKIGLYGGEDPIGVYRKYFAKVGCIYNKESGDIEKENCFTWFIADEGIYINAGDSRPSFTNGLIFTYPVEVIEKFFTNSNIKDNEQRSKIKKGDRVCKEDSDSSGLGTSGIRGISVSVGSEESSLPGKSGLLLNGNGVRSTTYEIRKCHTKKRGRKLSC